MEKRVQHKRNKFEKVENSSSSQTNIFVDGNPMNESTETKTELATTPMEEADPGQLVRQDVPGARNMKTLKEKIPSS